MNEDKVWRGARPGGGRRGGRGRPPTASSTATRVPKKWKKNRGGGGNGNEAIIPCPEVTNRLQLVGVFFFFNSFFFFPLFFPAPRGIMGKSKASPFSFV